MAEKGKKLVTLKWPNKELANKELGQWLLVERSLPTPEIRGSNPDISKILSTNCKIEKTRIKKKRPGMAHL